ncbi:MAG: Rrf2 family transcriptional regulator [Desulfobacterales bacterium]
MHLPGNATDAKISQLKRGGMVKSKRGFQGGYTLLRPPDRLTVGDIIRLIESPESLHCVSCISRDGCDLKGDCAFLPMWAKAQKAMVDVFDNTTIHDLIDGESQPTINPITIRPHLSVTAILQSWPPSKGHSKK